MHATVEALPRRHPCTSPPSQSTHCSPLKWWMDLASHGRRLRWQYRRHDGARRCSSTLPGPRRALRCFLSLCRYIYGSCGTNGSRARSLRDPTTSETRPAAAEQRRSGSPIRSAGKGALEVRRVKSDRVMLCCPRPAYLSTTPRVESPSSRPSRLFTKRWRGH